MSPQLRRASRKRPLPIVRRYEVEPFTVTLTSVKSDLTMVWAADNTIWLLPAYTFGAADGGMYSVIAVEDAYIHEADPVADGTTIEPAMIPARPPSPRTSPQALGGGVCTRHRTVPPETTAESP